MYISMWMIKENLKDYKIDSYIRQGDMNIRSASLLHQCKRYNAHILYLCKSELYFPTIKNKIICVNHNDFIIIEYDDLEEIFEKIQEIIDQFIEWDLEVQDMILDHCSLQDIADKAASIVRQMVCVQNSAFVIYGISGKEYVENAVPETYLNTLILGKSMKVEYTNRLISELEMHLTEKEPYIFQEPTLKLKEKALVQNVFINGCFWGFTYITLGSASIEIHKKHFLEVFTRHVLMWWMHNNEPLYLPDQNEFFLKLLESKMGLDDQMISEYMLNIGWEKTDEKYVIKISDRHENHLIYSRLIHHISQLYSYCYVLEYEQAIVLILNSRMESIEKFMKDIEVFFLNNHISYGVSYPFFEIKKLTLHYEQASIALKYAIQNKKTKMYCSECLLEYAKQFFKKNMETDIYHPLLHDLKQYDKEKNTDYFNTLKEYLFQERSIALAAQKLNIHKNTMFVRLRQIKDKFTFNLDDENERWSIILSFLLY